MCHYPVHAVLWFLAQLFVKDHALAVHLAMKNPNRKLDSMNATLSVVYQANSISVGSDFLYLRPHPVLAYILCHLSIRYAEGCKRHNLKLSVALLTPVPAARLKTTTVRRTLLVVAAIRSSSIHIKYHVLTTAATPFFLYYATWHKLPNPRRGDFSTHITKCRGNVKMPLQC
ncbi:hypothetical protein BC629DRAFT_1648503 [Irpex lacteus]|nr:hypothetical protein BC629DRAFT_1648503 [Irpex lacteus]